MSNLLYPSLPGLSWPIGRTALYSTHVQTSTSGQEVRLSNWAYARYKYNLSYEFLREGSKTDLQQIAGLFGRMRGQFDTFLFSDPDPAFSLAVNQTFGVGDGVTTVFRLARNYAAQVSEPVAACASEATVFINGAVSAACTVDANAGTVTFTAAPALGAVLTWTGSYLWRCRFDKDELATEQFMKDLWKGQVSFITCKLRT
ncbi:DUF2460 domain-containing protein [Limnohabitans sp.]|uniref:DUF2460 domain-containing protein n=1 Tax=Limnohabitans sp. TaxID=1907725 RepID=UPI00286EF43F|nr:DUF2460 domain-containing protein [Limnohabitans sp.]